MRTSVLNGLGQALRWLRDRQGKKQYQVADAAGITKGMLSAYETGRQRPSLDTLEKILGTLGCDLNDLHNAIQIINGTPEAMKRKGDDVERFHPPGDRDDPNAERIEKVRQSLGQVGRLSPEEQLAFGQMLDGFHRFLRYLHDKLGGSGGGEGGGSEE